MSDYDNFSLESLEKKIEEIKEEIRRRKRKTFYKSICNMFYRLICGTEEQIHVFDGMH